MSRELLLERLEALDPITAAECFVLLWTYLDLDRLKSAENFARARAIHPFRIEELLRAGGTPATGLTRTIAALRHREGAAFDFAAVQWIRALDGQRLRHRSRGSQEDLGPFVGLDGLLYRVRPRNEFLARTLRDHFKEAPTGVADQSGSIDLYTPYSKAIPERLKPGGLTSIELRLFDEWASPKVQSRLERRSEQRAFKVLLWPLTRHLEYLHGDESPGFVRLHGLRNEADLETEIGEALCVAREQRATVLVFPELSFPASALANLKRRLQSNRSDSYPLLLLAGCCHTPCGTGASDSNEAVLLDYKGHEVHRHRKLAAFSFEEDGQRITERLEVGGKVSILESPVGNLCILICLDLFHEPHKPYLSAAHASLYLVPSLSDKTSAHQARAKELVVTHRAGTFVSNRLFNPPGAAPSSPQASPGWASFFQLPARQQPRLHAPSEAPYLLFSLADEVSCPGQDK